MRIWDAFLPAHGEPMWIGTMYFGETAGESEVRQSVLHQRGPMPGLMLRAREIDVLEQPGDVGIRRGA